MKNMMKFSVMILVEDLIRRMGDEKGLILVDIDGTLVFKTNVDKEGDKDFQGIVGFGKDFWDVWNEKTIHAKKLVIGVEVVKELKRRGYTIVCVTVRGSSGRGVTVKKLKEIGVWGYVDGLWMRPLVCEKWYWEEEVNKNRKDSRNGKKWGSSQTKDYLVGIIERRYKKKFIGALEDENFDMLERRGIEYIAAQRYGGGK